jgi:hypothetical protein
VGSRGTLIDERGGRFGVKSGRRSMRILYVRSDPVGSSDRRDLMICEEGTYVVKRY